MRHTNFKESKTFIKRAIIDQIPRLYYGNSIAFIELISMYCNFFTKATFCLMCGRCIFHIRFVNYEFFII